MDVSSEIGAHGQRKGNGRWRTLLRLVLIFGCPVLIVFGWSLVSQKVVERDLEQARSRALSAGVPLSLSDYFAIEFRNSSTVQEPEFFKILKPFIPQSDDSDLVQHRDSFYVVNESIQNYLTASNRGKKNLLPDMKRVSLRNRQSVEAFVRALRGPRWQHHPSLQASTSESPFYDQFRNWIALCLLSAIVEAEEGNWSSASEKIQALALASTRIFELGTPAAHTMDFRVTSPHWNALVFLGTHEKAPASFRHMLRQSLRLEPSFYNPIQELRAIHAVLYSEYFSKDSEYRYRSHPEDALRHLWESILDPRISLATAERIWLEQMRMVMNDLNSHDASTDQVLDAIRRHERPANQAMDAAFPVGSFANAFGWMTEMVQQCKDLQRRRLAYQRVTATYLWCYEETRRTGRPPLSLLPGEKSTIDPYTLKDLRYIRTATSFTVYSIGKDGVDDRGTKKGYASHRNGDIGLSYPKQSTF